MSKKLIVLKSIINLIELDKKTISTTQVYKNSENISFGYTSEIIRNLIKEKIIYSDHNKRELNIKMNENIKKELILLIRMYEKYIGDLNEINKKGPV